MSPAGDSNAAPSSSDTHAAVSEPAPTTTRKWDDAPLAQEMFIIHNLMMRAGDKLISSYGLTASRWLMLGALEQYHEPPTLTELSNDALLSVQNVSRMAAALETEGLIERFTVPGRGRATFVRITEEGWAVIARTKDACARFRRAMLAGLSEADLAALERGVERIISNLETFDAELAQENTGTTPP